MPDIPDALKQRIQREAFLCNELTIREEDLSKDQDEDEEDIEQEEIIWDLPDFDYAIIV